MEKYVKGHAVGNVVMETVMEAEMMVISRIESRIRIIFKHQIRPCRLFLPKDK